VNVVVLVTVTVAMVLNDVSVNPDIDTVAPSLILWALAVVIIALLALSRSRVTPVIGENAVATAVGLAVGSGRPSS
jgi:hypothetical protein